MATGNLESGTIEFIGKVEEQGTTIIYIKLEHIRKPIRINLLSLLPSERAWASWAKEGDHIGVRCDWGNKDTSYHEGISFEMSY